MYGLRGAVIAVAVAVSVMLIAGCEGPVEKAGKKVDKAVDEVRR
jgi:outer membrane murein-binding lipoprotein Lpp